MYEDKTQRESLNIQTRAIHLDSQQLRQSKQLPPAADFGSIQPSADFLCLWQTCKFRLLLGEQGVPGESSSAGAGKGQQLWPRPCPGSGSLTLQGIVSSLGSAPSQLLSLWPHVSSYRDFGLFPWESLQLKHNIIFLFGSHPASISGFTECQTLWIL